MTTKWLRYFQWSLRRYLAVVFFFGIILALLSGRLVHYYRLLRLDSHIANAGGETSWLTIGERWRRDYYGTPEYNSVEAIGSREFFRNIAAWNRNFLHVELRSIVIDHELALDLASTEIVSFDIYDCAIAKEGVRFSENARFARVEANDAETLRANLEAFRGSTIEWLSVRIDCATPQDLVPVANLSNLRVLVVHSINASEPSTLSVALRDHKSIEELYLSGFRFRTSIQLDEVIGRVLKKCQIEDSELNAEDVSEAKMRYPNIEWVIRQRGRDWNEL